MHRTTRAAVLGAVAIAAALGVSGCGDQPAAAPAPTEALSAAEPPAAGATAPLPPPSALAEVVIRIADANVPGATKLDAIENATPGDGASMDQFGQALRDGGYAPAVVEARDLEWSDGGQRSVLALVTIGSADAPSDVFEFPMEFRLADRWQLTRETADALLHLGEQPTPTPPP